MYRHFRLSARPYIYTAMFFACLDVTRATYAISPLPANSMLMVTDKSISGSAGKPDTTTVSDSTTIRRLDNIVVSARKADLDRSSVTRISADAFIGKLTDLPAILEQVSGVTVNRTGGFGEYADASIRGASPHQVQVYLDGIPLNSAEGGAVDLSKISPASLRDVTVYKGTVPLDLMGSSAGAVIDLHSAEGGPGTSAVLEAGSFGYRKAGVMAGSARGSISHRISVDYAQSRNDYPYTDDNGTPYNSADNSIKRKDNNAFFLAGVRYAGNWNISTRSRLDYLLSASGSRKEFFQKHLVDTTQVAQQSSASGHGFVNLTTGMQDEGYIAARLEGRFNRRLFEDPLGQYYIGGKRRDREDFPGGSLQLSALRRFGEWLQVKTLIRGAYDGYASINLLSPSPAVAPVAGRAGASGALELSIRRDSLHLAVRYQHLFVRDSANFTPDHGIGTPLPQVMHGHYPNGNFDLLWRPLSWLSADAALRYEFQPVNLSDRYGWGNNYLGNHKLRPERRTEGSIGLTVRYRVFESSASGFIGATFDLIELRPQYQQLVMAENGGDITFAGVEWDLHLRPCNKVAIDNHFTFVDKQRRDRHGENDATRPILFSSPFENDLRVAIALGPVTIGHSLHYRSPFLKGYTASHDLMSPAPMLTAYIAATLPKNITITYRIENYSNVSYETLPGYAPVPGRMHFITGKIEW